MHLGECRECALHRAEVRSLRTGLKSLPEKSVVSAAATRLRVIASRERSRQALRRDLAARLRDLRSRAKLMFDNLLRPIAVPAAGGMLASFLLLRDDRGHSACPSGVAERYPGRAVYAGDDRRCVAVLG